MVNWLLWGGLVCLVSQVEGRALHLPSTEREWLETGVRPDSPPYLELPGESTAQALAVAESAAAAAAQPAGLTVECWVRLSDWSQPEASLVARPLYWESAGATRSATDPSVIEVGPDRRTWFSFNLGLTLNECGPSDPENTPDDVQDKKPADSSGASTVPNGASPLGQGAQKPCVVFAVAVHQPSNGADSQSLGSPQMISTQSKPFRLTANHWNHLAGVWSAEDGVVRVLVDGVLASESSLPPNESVAQAPFALAPCRAPVFIGRASSLLADRDVRGHLDDVRLWSFALATADISLDRRSRVLSTFRDGLPAGLAVAMSFDDGAMVARDSVGAMRSLQLGDVARAHARLDSTANAPLIDDDYGQMAAADASPENNLQSQQNDRSAAADFAEEPLNPSLLARQASKSTDRRSASPVDADNVRVRLDAASDASGHNVCEFGIRPLWRASLGSGVLSDPIIADLAGDGTKEVVFTTHEHFVEVVKGDSGAKAPGWPYGFAGGARFMASPLAYDLDGDGRDEILVTTQNAQVIALSETGLPRAQFTIKVPEFSVQRDWAAGMSAHDVDVHYSLLADKYQQADDPPLDERQDSQDRGRQQRSAHQAFRQRSPLALSDDDGGDDSGEDAGQAHKPIDWTADQIDAPAAAAASSSSFSMERPDLGSFFDSLTPEAIASFDLFMATDTPLSYAQHVLGLDATGRNGDAVPGQAAPDGSPRSPLFSRFYESWWNATQDQRMSLGNAGRHAPHQGPGGAADGAQRVWLDAHCLATPTIGDLEGDGRAELIVPVSYFFDITYSSDEVAAARLPTNVDPSGYVVSGLAVFDLDLETGTKLRQRVALDLTTQDSPLAAFVTSSPVLADIDSDGQLDILLTTGAGFLYALDGRSLAIKDGYPVATDAVYSEPLVDDVTGDGRLDIVIADANSYVVCLEAATGREQWERRVSGHPQGHPVAGDVDGDGHLDVVLATSAGHVWALNGATGAPLAHFPVLTGGALLAAPLLVELADAELCGPMQIVVAGQDGVLYLIDGAAGCADRVDLGLPSFSMVLADDLTGNGRLDLLVATGAGQAVALATRSPYHPLKSWRMPFQSPSGGNGASARNNHLGVYVEDDGRQAARQIRSQPFPIRVTVVDERRHRVETPSAEGWEWKSRRQRWFRELRRRGLADPHPEPAADGSFDDDWLTGQSTSSLVDGSTMAAAVLREDHYYSLQFSLGQGGPLLLATGVNQPGTYTFWLNVPLGQSYWRHRGALVVSMRTPGGLLSEDEFAVALSAHAPRLVKWLLALPILALFLFSWLFLDRRSGAAIGEKPAGHAHEPLSATSSPVAGDNGAWASSTRPNVDRLVDHRSVQVNENFVV